LAKLRRLNLDAEQIEPAHRAINLLAHEQHQHQQHQAHHIGGPGGFPDAAVIRQDHQGEHDQPDDDPLDLALGQLGQYRAFAARGCAVDKRQPHAHQREDGQHKTPVQALERGEQVREWIHPRPSCAGASNKPSNN
jgi:hypothetical protein